MESVFGPTRILAGCLPGFETRPQQIKMAGAVARALEENSCLIAEAGPGTGKTLAYLVPAIASQKRVVISTGTRALQDQIVHKDLPLLQDCLYLPLRVALMKGRSNYLCLRRLH
jgi:ATP-dependent DNA helicase DinG